jgi:hypothetical protein
MDTSNRGELAHRRNQAGDSAQDAHRNMLKLAHRKSLRTCVHVDRAARAQNRAWVRSGRRRKAGSSATPPTKGRPGPRSTATLTLLQGEREGAGRRALGEREGAARRRNLSNAPVGRRHR